MRRGGDSAVSGNITIYDAGGNVVDTGYAPGGSRPGYGLVGSGGIEWIQPLFFGHVDGEPSQEKEKNGRNPGACKEAHDHRQEREYCHAAVHGPPIVH
jgi:hypothetical protein